VIEFVYQGEPGTSSKFSQVIEFVYQGEPGEGMKFTGKSPGDDWEVSKSTIWMA
jgi:hypothetical protein